MRDPSQAGRKIQNLAQRIKKFTILQESPASKLGGGDTKATDNLCASSLQGRGEYKSPLTLMPRSAKPASATPCLVSR